MDRFFAVGTVIAGAIYVATKLLDVLDSWLSGKLKCWWQALQVGCKLSPSWIHTSTTALTAVTAKIAGCLRSIRFTNPNAKIQILLADREIPVVVLHRSCLTFCFANYGWPQSSSADSRFRSAGAERRDWW